MNSYDTSPVTIDALIPSSFPENNLYTPMEEVQKEKETNNTKKENAPDQPIYVFIFILIGYNSIVFLFLLLVVNNIFLLCDAILQFSLLFCFCFW